MQNTAFERHTVYEQAEHHAQSTMLGTGKIQCILRHNNEDIYMVAGSVGMVRARRAAGCLLAPEQNDTVLAMLSAEGNYILHVLERDSSDARVILPAHTSVIQEASVPQQPQDATENTAKRRLQIDIDDLTIQASQNVHIQSPTVRMDAEDMSITAHMLRMSGRVLQRQFFSLRDVCAHMFTRAGKVLQCYGKRTERVDDVLDTKAARVRLTAEKSVRVRAEDADIRAQEVVTVDGKHVHIG